MKSRPRKPIGQKLCVHKLSFSLVELDANDFLDIVQGEAVAIQKWLRCDAGYWSATITPTSEQDDSEPLLMNVRPERMITPKTLIEGIRHRFDQFKIENAGYMADDVTVLVTISNRKPASVYGEVRS